MHMKSAGDVSASVAVLFVQMVEGWSQRTIMAQNVRPC